MVCVLLLACPAPRSWCDAPKSPDEAAARHAQVAARRGGVEIICHRGALEFAHENTLEAYRAALELGADGNEIDIRATRDGVLVCFHDDMLDRLLEAYGTVRELDWEQLRSLPFRDPGPFDDDCRIPTLAEVLELHRQYAGLLHLDIKEPGLDGAIARLIDEFDMWDHVAYCNQENAEAIMQSPTLRLGRYKAGLYEDRGEVHPEAIATALAREGNGVILEDPRGLLVALSRPLGKVSTEPVAPVARKPLPAEPTSSVEALVAIVRDAEDCSVVAESASEMRASGQRIRARARAAEQLLAAEAATNEVFEALEERARHRSLHKDWMFHAFDGAMALRALVRLQAPRAVEVSRYVLWLDDPAVEAVQDPRWGSPRSWTDFRMKMLVFTSLAMLPGPETEQLCRDYLDLGDDEARMIGPPQFEAAARTLLTASPTTETALPLLKHRLQAVRGRAILVCLANVEAPWARRALAEAAPHALDYVVPR